MSAELEADFSDPDAELVKRAQNGDRDAFSELIAAYYDFIFRIAFKWLGQQSDAEDVAQEVCVRLARVIGSFEGRSRFRSWLYRIVINTARDVGRKTQRRAETDVDQAGEIVSGDRSAEDNLHDADLWRSVRQLPPRQADAVLLVYAEERSHAEAANILGCSESTVSWHIHEAKKALRSLLDQ